MQGFTEEGQPIAGRWLGSLSLIVVGYTVFEVANFYSMASRNWVDVRMISTYLVEQLVPYFLLTVCGSIAALVGYLVFVSRPDRMTLRHCFFWSAVAIAIGDVLYKLPVLYEVHVVARTQEGVSDGIAVYAGALCGMAWGVLMYLGLDEKSREMSE
jgi:hypothetical protein